MAIGEPRRLFIPPLGTELTLLTSWTFKLYFEYRNEKLLAALGSIRYAFRDPYWWARERNAGRKHVMYTFPANTVVVIDRIYIRQGSEDYNSVTFRTNHPTQPKKRVRFWAKLDDVNQMVVADL